MIAKKGAIQKCYGVSHHNGFEVFRKSARGLTFFVLEREVIEGNDAVAEESAITL